MATTQIKFSLNEETRSPGLGCSLSGKTTLVREMLRLGATYYSDEFAVVDDSGLVHPFARPLGIREDFFPAQTNYTAENLGASTGVKPLPLGRCTTLG